MLRLLTLGTAAIVDESGSGPGLAGAQRRTVALLSVLAVAGQLGLSRDKLVALFWPDADTERGRHALTQALYASRRSVRCDDLFVVNGDVRLNSDRITSDIGDLESALTSDPERALALYRGPFLDGFFLPGSAEFERWASTERARIEEAVVRALDQLATAARNTGDASRAADWWKRAAGLRPLDSRVAVRLMEALAAAGDRAGALQHAAIHTTLLRNELGLDADAAVTALARALRDPSNAAATSGGATAPAIEPRSVAVADVGEQDATSADMTDVARLAPATTVPHEVQIWVPPRPHARAWRLSLLVITGAALVAIGIAIGRTRHRVTDFQPIPLRQRVVVAPFRVAGAASSLAYLRDGMVELLSTRLADDSTARSVDAGAVIGAWRAAGLAPAMDVSRDTVVRLAARLGAERVVVGGVVGTPGRIVVRATVLRVPSGAVASQATVEGSADSISGLVDHLAARLLLAEAGEDDRLGKHMTSSLPALRAYLVGQAAFRRNDYATALQQYENSLLRDSTFALAALRLAIAADRIDDAARVRRALRIAWSFRTELAERDHAMLLTFTGERFPAPPLAREQIGDWQHAADLAPGSAEAWLALGARLFHDGAVAGVSGSAEQAATALQRALLVDSNYAPAARLLAQLATRGDTGIAFPATARRIALDDSLSPLAPFVRWRLALVESDTSALGAIKRAFVHLGPTNLRAIALASQFDAIALADGVRALGALRLRSAGRAREVDVLLGEHAMALNEGRIHDALEATTPLTNLLLGSHAGLRLRTIDGLYGDGDTLAARAAAGDLERIREAAGAGQRADSPARSADLCVIGQWQLATGHAGDVPGIVSELRSGPVAGLSPIGAESAACAELLDAGIAVASRRRDARTRVAHLDSLAFTAQTAGDAAAYAPLWIARLYEQVGDTRGALRAIRRRQYMSDWPRYLASMLREEGRLAESTGDIAGAREAYRRYLALRHSPDAALASQVDAVRRASDRLATGAPPHAKNP